MFKNFNAIILRKQIKKYPIYSLMRLNKLFKNKKKN